LILEKKRGGVTMWGRLHGIKKWRTRGVAYGRGNQIIRVREGNLRSGMVGERTQVPAGKGEKQGLTFFFTSDPW